MTTKTIFVTGKGGVGKSTLSAALAWQLAENGYRVLAASFDPAHNLGDVFGTKLSHSRKCFSSNLFLQEVDLEKASGDYVRENVDLIQETYSYTKALNMDRYFRVLKYSPGVEEYAAVTWLEGIFREKLDLDFIVFDTPPTGLTLRVFALPRVTLTWIDRLIRVRKEILDKRYTIHKVGGASNQATMKLAYKEEDDRVMQKLLEMQARYTSLRECLEGDNNSVAVVFNPDFLSLRESQRLIAGLKELELPLRVAFDNKVRAEEQETAQSIEAEMMAECDGVPLERIPFAPQNNEHRYVLQHDLTRNFV